MTKRRIRNVPLYVWVKPDEQEAIQQRMASLGIQNMSAYIRNMALNGYVLNVDISPVRELVSLLRRCSNNLNQTAIHANTYGGLYPNEIRDLQRDYAALWEKTNDVLKQLAEVTAIAQSMKDRFDYGQNPDKTQDGDLILSYKCDPKTADAEFLLSKAKYKAVTGREQKKDADVLCYQIRQSFPPGELDAEAALKVSYDLAMRWTKGNHAFFVVSHIDRPHPHCHIYYNSTSLDCTRKFRDFLGSARALRKLSDRVCVENDLSVIQNPKLHSKGKFRHYGQWLGANKQPTYQERLCHAIDRAIAERPADFAAFLRHMEAASYEVKEQRGVVSFRAEGQERFTRLRADTLGEGYSIEDIRAAIGGRSAAPRRQKKISLAIDIQQRMAAGKGPGYERWAKVFNLKQMAAALVYIQENNLTDYAELADKAAKATDAFHTLEWQLKGVDADIERTAELMGATVDYAKTRAVFDGYKAAKYSRKYLAEHEDDIKIHRAARATFDRVLNGGKLPKMDALKKERQKLIVEKKTAREEYKKATEEMREVVTVKANIDSLLEVTGGGKNKEMER